MPPQTASPSLHLLIQPSTFYLTQLKASSPLPLPLVSQISTPSSSTTFLSITRTDEEISIVSDVDLGLEGDVVERPTKWCCLKVAGPMDLGGSYPFLACFENIPSVVVHLWCRVDGNHERPYDTAEGRWDSYFCDFDLVCFFFCYSIYV